MQAFSSPQQDPPTAYLGNLHPDTLQSDIDKLFQGLNLQDVRIVRDKETDEPKGYGYAVFKDQESLEQACQLNGSDVCGNKIKVDVKKPSNRNRGGNMGGQRTGGFRSDFGGGAFGGRQQQDRRPDRANRPVPDEPPFTAYVGNLPEEAVQSDLETMFQGLDLIKVHLVMDRETQRHRGYGYAEFNSRESLVRALSLDGAQWMGKALKVNVHERQRFENRGGFNNGGGRFDQGQGGQRFDQGQGGQRFDQGQGGPGRFDQGQAGSGRFDQGQAGSGRFEQGQGGAGRFDQGGGRFARNEAFGDRRSNRPQNLRPAEEPAPINDGKERPKLVLQKKSEGGSSQTPRSAEPSNSNKPNPFGNAKPVDTAAKLREMDESKKVAGDKEETSQEGKPAEEGAQ